MKTPRSTATLPAPKANSETLPADDLWLGWFDPPPHDTITVYPTAEPEPIGILNAEGQMLCRPAPRIGFPTWNFETDGTSASGSS